MAFTMATATAAMTATTTTTGTTGVSASAQSPATLPTTGGETTNWAAAVLAVGVAALLLGGALTVTRRSR